MDIIDRIGQRGGVDLPAFAGGARANWHRDDALVVPDDAAVILHTDEIVAAHRFEPWP
jgi:hypothetical protein